MRSWRPAILAVTGVMSVSAVAGARAQEEESRPPAAPEPEPTAPQEAPTDPDDRPGSDTRTNAPDIRRTYVQQGVEQDTITRNWFGQGEKLEDAGITLTLNFFVLFQGNVDGGQRQGSAGTGQYRLGANFDLEKLVGLGGGGIFLRVNGGWDDVADLPVPTLSSVNGEFVFNHGILVSHLWYQQDLLDDRIRLRVGKQNIADGFDFHGQTVAFDANAYANFGGTQFTNSFLINNGSIPFPNEGLGAVSLVEPLDRVYLSAGIINTGGDPESFSDAFRNDVKWLLMFETGLVVDFSSSAGPLPGQFNAGYWYSEFEAQPPGYGIYLGMNQLLLREGSEYLQGLGVFARYGYSEGSPLGVRHFWSAGVNYRGAIPGRDSDVVALGWAQAFTNGASGFTAAYEGVLEAYYRLPVTPWFIVTPAVQYIVNPGSTTTPDALILGLRGQFVF